LTKIKLRVILTNVIERKFEYIKAEVPGSHKSVSKNKRQNKIWRRGI